MTSQTAEERALPTTVWPDRPRRGRKPTSQKLAEIHDRALREFDTIQSAMRDARLQCLKDRRFYSIAGAQWEGPLQNQFANKPRFEANLIQLAAIRIFNEYRNNRISVAFVSKDGSPNEKLADVCAGLFRADEQDSVAEEAHDNAFDEGVGGGFGAWRLRAAYEDDDNPDDERQRIIIEPIFDADSSVYFDLNAKRQDKADAKRCFVLHSMTRQSFIDEWGYDPATMPKTVHQYEFDWATPSVVFVAEFYEVEIRVEKLLVYENLAGEREEYTEDELTEIDEESGLSFGQYLDAIGAKEVEEKKRRVRRVHKYLMSGDRILEDCGYIAGKCIPIIPFYGKRWFVDNVERCSGVTRTPTDMQRLLNMQLSRLGEIAALSTIEKPIFTPEQMQGHTELWANDNLVNNPYLLVNPITDENGKPIATGPLAYTKPPAIPPALGAIMEITTQLIRELLGNQQAAEQVTPNVSGKAIELVQNRLDMQAFIYMSNMAKSIKREGQVWLSMAKDILTKEGRRMKTVTAQGNAGSVVISQPVVRDGVQKLENDLTKADFDVSVTVGPSSDSKRSATVRALTGLLAITENPADKEVLTGMALMNMTGEGLEDVNAYYRQKMIRMGVVKPTEEEAAKLKEEMANQPPSPDQKLIDALATESDAKAKKANADTIKTLADADKSVSETAKNYATIEQDGAKVALDAAQTFANADIETARAVRDDARTE